MKRLSYIFIFIAAVVLTAVSNFADFLMQAFEFGWNTPIALTTTKEKLTLFGINIDALAFLRDSWHLTQSVKLAAFMFGFFMFGYFFKDIVASLFTITRLQTWQAKAQTSFKYALLFFTCVFISVVVFHWITRGLGFTLPRLFYQGY